MKAAWHLMIRTWNTMQIHVRKFTNINRSWNREKGGFSLALNHDQTSNYPFVISLVCNIICSWPTASIDDKGVSWRLCRVLCWRRFVRIEAFGRGVWLYFRRRQKWYLISCTCNTWKSSFRSWRVQLFQQRLLRAHDSEMPGSFVLQIDRRRSVEDGGGSKVDPDGNCSQKRVSRILDFRIKSDQRIFPNSGAKICFEQQTKETSSCGLNLDKSG